MHTPAVMSHDLNQAGEDWQSSPLGSGLASAVGHPAISDQCYHCNNLSNAVTMDGELVSMPTGKWRRAATVSCQQFFYRSVDAVKVVRNAIVYSGLKWYRLLNNV